MNLLGALARNALGVNAELDLVGVIGLAATLVHDRSRGVRLTVRALVRLRHVVLLLPLYFVGPVGR